MNQIIKVDEQLPAAIEELHKFIIIGRGRLEAYRHALEVIDKMPNLDDAYMKRREELLEQAQNFGTTIIGAEQQFGGMIKKIFPPGRPWDKPQGSLRFTLESYGITYNESMRARALCDYTE